MVRKYDHYRTIIHPLIAFVLPASFLISFVLLAAEQYRMVYIQPPGFMNRLCLSLFLISFFSGLTAVIFGNLFQTERVRWTARVRECMVLALIVYTVASFFRTGPLLTRFIPALANVLPAVYSVCQWICSVWIQKGLRDREVLVLELEGKEGTVLYTTLREMGLQADTALKALGRIRIQSTAGALALFFLLIPQETSNIHLSVSAIASVMVYFAVFLFMLAVCSQYSFEQYAAGAGLREEDRQRSSRLRYSAVLIMLAGITAFFVHGKAPLIPIVTVLNLLRRLGNWLLRLIPILHFSSGYEPLPEPVVTERMKLVPMDMEGGFDIRFILEVINRFLPLLLVVLLVIFLLTPLLSKRYRVMISRHSPGIFISGLWLLIRRWFGKRDEDGEDGFRLDPDNMASVRKRLQRLGPAQTDRVRRRELGRVSRAFVRLIRWGRRSGIIFTATSAPGSYAQRLAERFPDQKEDLVYIADCFEEAAYSPNPLGKERLAEYEQSIRKIIRI